MTYSTRVLHSVNECESAWWNELGKGTGFTSWRWYQYGETVLANSQPLYIVVEKDARPVARATFWVKRVDALPIASNLLYHGMNAVFNRWPLLSCQSPLANASGLLLPDGSEREEIFGLLMGRANAAAQEIGASFLVLDFISAQQAKQLNHSGKLSGVDMNEPGTILEIIWPDFDAYLQSRSKSVSKDYRRAGNKVKRMGVEIRVEARVTDIAAAAALIQRHDKTYKSPTLPWLEEMLRHIDLVDSIWLGAYAGEKLVGCGLLLGDNDTWVATALGRDYDYPYVYFALGYASIRNVIERGGKYLRLGTGTYDFKKRLGCELEANDHVAFMAQNKLVDTFFRKIAARLVG
ncbi:MAG: GNAT family N-acetyltransferase [Anaerolineales bacterium]|nr:GNAT family N-acetyltransferase [Anaerolineales bacterium]